MAESKIQTDKVLLWTNPNPGAAMGDTTLSLDLSPYEFIEVWYQENGYGGVYKKALISIGVNSYIFGAAGGTTTRQFTTSTSSIHIFQGMYYQAYGGNSAVYNNSVVLPLKIYGIRGNTN